MYHHYTIATKSVPDCAIVERYLSRSQRSVGRLHSSKVAPFNPDRISSPSPPRFYLQNGYLMVAPNHDVDSQEEEISTQSVVTSCSRLSPGSSDGLATALGYTSDPRILTFESPHSKKVKSWSLIQPECGYFHTKFIGKAPSPCKDIPYKVLDAPGLRNDYYSNAVCWANNSDRLCVGLGSSLYSWTESSGVNPLQTINDYDPISAMSYSAGDVLAVGTKGGRVMVYEKGSFRVSSCAVIRPNRGVSCIRWATTDDTELFFVGDDSGGISLFEWRWLDGQYVLVLLSSFKCSNQQVCGLDVNQDCTQLAVGCNDNRCMLYLVGNLNSPEKIHTLTHYAAVKAVAFCPWLPNMLVTGGGSKDKCIRFWHTQSGTLVKSHRTACQVTSLVWCHRKMQLLATFGFGSLSKHKPLLSVFSYPSMQEVLQVDGPPELRILSSDLSNTHNSICAALSDESVRIYNVWDSLLDLRSGQYGKGLFESELIDLEEGAGALEQTIR